MLLLFDLDGTLVDSLMDLSDACNQALMDLNLPTYDYDSYRYFIGNGVKNMILRALKDEHASKYAIVREKFNSYYLDNCLVKTRPYEGISEVVRSLKQKGHHICCITNKDHHLALKICHELFGSDIDLVLGHLDQFALKPDPQIIDYALSHFTYSKEECLFIGDSNVDIESGKNANMKTIGVTWGNRPESELRQAGAHYIANNTQELERIIGEANDCL